VTRVNILEFHCLLFPHSDEVMFNVTWQHLIGCCGKHLTYFIVLILFLFVVFSFVCSVCTVLTFFCLIIGHALLSLHVNTFKWAYFSSYLVFNLNLVFLLSSCGTTLHGLSVITVLLVCIHLTCRPAVATFAFAKIYNYCIFNISIVTIVFRGYVCYAPTLFVKTKTVLKLFTPSGPVVTLCTTNCNVRKFFIFPHRGFWVDTNCKKNINYFRYKINRLVYPVVSDVRRKLHFADVTTVFKSN
jgi:hypothetical protein